MGDQRAFGGRIQRGAYPQEFRCGEDGDRRPPEGLRQTLHARAGKGAQEQEGGLSSSEDLAAFGRPP